MKDVLLDENFDLAIKDGDFVFGESTKQNQILLLLARKGEFKNWLLAGVGLKDMYDDEDPKKILIEAKHQFEDDGMEVDSIKLESNGDLTIEANYK